MKFLFPISKAEEDRLMDFNEPVLSLLFLIYKSLGFVDVVLSNRSQVFPERQDFSSVLLLLWNMDLLSLLPVQILRFVEGRNHLVQRTANHRGIVLFQSGGQNGQLPLQLLRSDGGLPFHKDLVVLRFLNVPAGNQQLLIQLFPRPQTGLHDINIPIRCVPGQADQILRQVQNLYRAAHVQYVQLILPAMAPA